MYTTNMTEQAARQICDWKYPVPYSVYNYLSYEEALKSNAHIIQSEHADDFLCFWNEDGSLIAYISFITKSNKLFIGIGLAPACCGKGLGKDILLCGIEEAQKRHAGNTEIWVQVRSWNKRAIKCYLSCGFKTEYSKILKDRLGNDEEFCFMRLCRD